MQSGVCLSPQLIFLLNQATLRGYFKCCINNNKCYGYVISMLRLLYNPVPSILWETLINSASEMKYETSGTQQLRHINKIGEGVSTAQRSDSLVQPINQRFLSLERLA